MTVLRILPYHAGKIPDFSEKLPHKMSFYCDLVIICEGNERAGQAGEKRYFPPGLRELWGARLPVENIFFHILRSSEARIFPLAGKSAFFRPYVILFVKIAQLYK